MNTYFNALTFIALYYFQALKCWIRQILLRVFIIILPNWKTELKQKQNKNKNKKQNKTKQNKTKKQKQQQ